MEGHIEKLRIDNEPTEEGDRSGVNLTRWQHSWASRWRVRRLSKRLQVLRWDGYQGYIIELRQQWNGYW